MSTAGDVDCSSDSEWLDISSNPGTDTDFGTDLSEPESDSEPGAFVSRPLSRLSLSASSEDGRIDRWEGLVEDALDGVPAQAHPEATPTADRDVPQEQADATADLEEELRVKQALDQSMISTLSSRPQSTHSSLHDLRASRSSTHSQDLRLSFPDPLSSSRNSQTSFTSLQDVDVPHMLVEDTESPGSSAFDDDDLTFTSYPTETETEAEREAYRPELTRETSLTAFSPIPEDYSILDNEKSSIDGRIHPQMYKHVSFTICKAALSDRRNVMTILTILSVVLGYIVNGTMHPQTTPTSTLAGSVTLPTPAPAAPAPRPVSNVSAATPHAAAALIPSTFKEFAMAVLNPHSSALLTTPSAASESRVSCPYALATRTASALSLVPKTASSLSLVKPSSSALSVVQEMTTSLSVPMKAPTSLSVVDNSADVQPVAGPSRTAVIDIPGMKSSAIAVLDLPKAQANAKALTQRLRARFWNIDPIAGALADAVISNTEELLRALDELANVIGRQTRYFAKQIAEIRQMDIIEVAVRVGYAVKNEVLDIGREIWEDARRDLRFARKVAREARTQAAYNARGIGERLMARHDAAKENARKIVGRALHGRRGTGRDRREKRAQRLLWV